MHIYVTVSGITCMISVRARLKYKILFSSHLNSSDMIDVRLLLSLYFGRHYCVIGKGGTRRLWWGIPGKYRKNAQEAVHFSFLFEVSSHRLQNSPIESSKAISKRLDVGRILRSESLETNSVEKSCCQWQSAQYL